MVVKSFCILCLCKPLVISTRYMSKQVKKPRLSPSVALRDNGRSGREASTSSSGTGPSRRKLPSRNVKQTESDRSTSSNTASVTDNVVFRTEDIDKSPNDSKSYRHIELRNGLRALLITDPNEGGSSTTVTGSDGSKSDTTSSGEEEEEDDKSVKLSAAGLCIGTGSFCDPREAQGLAHFLEHMVFMGSEKYPEENAYDSFIKKHGGDDNASTDCEKTLFYFDIQHEVFREALDMFSQFFINPLLKQSSMSREIQAIESEFEQSITSDFVRKQQLKAYMATEGHPVGTFMWGNTQSLMGGNKAEGLHARLQEFHRHMYSAQYMTLAVQADESLDKLEKWVAETFSKIPNNGAPRKDFSTSGPVFDESRFCKLYRVVPVKNVNQIEITWSVPSQHRHFRSKPLGYLSFLIGHESEGSILSYLKKKCWALGLYGGTGDSGFEHNTANALFTITITLTEDGLTNYQYVLMAVFQYLAMLKREGPQQHIYEEIKLVDEIDFVWQEECDPTENVEDLCSEMQLYPPKYYLSGSSLLLDYEPQIIQDCLERLSPRTCNIMILSKTFEEQKICDRVEPWYKTQYSVSEIDPSWIRQWQNLKKNEDFHLPPPNKFIATDFELKTATVDTAMKEVHKPVLILNNEQSRLWYKKNNKFNVPKAYIFFHLITPLANQTPQTMVLFDLFVRILKQNLTEKTYPADLAQLWYDFKGVETGLSIKLGGFNHKLSKLFEVMVDNLVEFDTSQDMFDAVKDQVSREYFNHFLRPARLITDLRLSVLQQKYWSAVDKRCFVGQITREMLLSFVQEFKLKLYIEGLVIGNMSAEEALKLEEYLCGKLKCAVLPRNTRPEPRCVQLPTGNFHYCRVENFNKEDVNSSVIHYYQLEPTSIRGTALCDLANTCMEEPCFDILRTREQLGYSVWCASHLTNGILGLSLNVETSTSKFSLDQVDEKMTSFLQNFGHTLASMSNSQFKNHVKALTGLKKKEETNLNEEADKYWIEILGQNYVFDRMEKEIKALSTLTKSDLVHWYKVNITNKDRHRKLCIQVQGSTTGSPSVDLALTPRPPLRRYSSISCHGIKVSQHLAHRTQQRNEAIERGGIWDLNYLNVGKVPLKNCIMDISSFKRRLPVYPVHKADT